MSRRDEEIKIKMQKSVAFIKEAETLLENKFYNTLINRLYYSCFHATKALLLSKDLVSKTHSGTISLLNQKFVQEGAFDSEKAAFFKERVVEFIEPSKQYIEYVFKLIEEYFKENPNNPDRPSLFP